jgi:UTP-glucose-1-phosphate uridylyltransferase
VRYDVGDKMGFLQATVGHALLREDLGSAMRAYILDLVKDKRYFN